MRSRNLAPFLVVILLCAGCQEDATTHGTPTAPAGQILIGSDLPSAGFYEAAVSAQNAIRLAIAQHPIVGGRFKLAYWPLDDSVAENPNQEKGIQNVSQMIDDARVLGMVGPFNSFVGDVEIPVANQSYLAMVSPSNTNPCLTVLSPDCGSQPDTLRPTGRINYFRIAPPDALQGTAMARYVARGLNLKQVAVINEWGSDGDLIATSFAKELELAGGKVVLREDFDTGTTDFTNFLAAAHAKGAQAIYALGNAQDDLVCVARSQMPADMLFLGTDGFSGDPLCISQAAGASGSILATKPDVDITGSKDPAAADALRAFQKAYPSSKVLEYTFASYDCARILIAAIEQAVAANNGSLPNRRQVLDAVAQIRFTGVTGTYSFDQYGDATSPLMSVYQVENGKWVYLTKVDASPTPS
jgi:branched-chain amino acid transport system substrate-binding protein